ncbi:MAG: hypothetical protein Q8914_14690 [Bacteroidota bacterium]|nr:hypothetical protein [Bacteroidota bacterium]
MQAWDEHGIRPDVIAGTSAGSIHYFRTHADRQHTLC